MLVMKFGGSSVADRSAIETVKSIVEARLPRRPLVVCSAHKGITDALVGIHHDLDVVALARPVVSNS